MTNVFPCRTDRRANSQRVERLHRRFSVPQADHARLYGDNYLRLLNVKAAVDPTGVFTLKTQSIPVKSLSERVKICLTAAGVEAAIPGEFETKRTQS
ncbi:hypothetical protein DIPPA_33908 [Diplonema papillatum]|nr:hypothetical protein DIPPA_33908 [Diplonema papillatum]